MNQADRRASYGKQYAVFARRRTWARITQFAMTTLGVVLAAAGSAMVLGAGLITPNMLGTYLAQRHIPGPDGSISLQEATRYALINEKGDPLTPCTITPGRGGEPLAQTPRDGEGMNFDAEVGQYIVRCEDNPDNEGIAVFREEDMDTVGNDIHMPLLLQGLPFLGVGVALLIGSKFAAKHIAPERLRPDVPA